MKRIILFYLLLFPVILIAQEKHTLYLIPGHGSDIRVYSKLKFPDNIDTVHLHWILPLENETLDGYAVRFSKKIDTTRNFSIMGLSLGGMIACEMTRFMNPQNVFIISSSAGRSELPLRYRMLRNFEIYRLFSPGFYKKMTKAAQLIYEPDRINEAEIFDAMIKDKDAVFIKRAIHMIANWEGEFGSDGNIIHIHGTRDHTIPIRNTCSDLIVDNGSHMMVLTFPEPIEKLLELYFKE